MNNAQAYLETIYGVSARKEDTPAHEIQGILHTKNYIDFIIYSNDGRPIYSFSGAKQANRCLPGDHVWWNGSELRCELDLRDEHPLIVGTLETTNQIRYGMTKKKNPMYLFTPYDSRYPQFIVGSSERPGVHNLIVCIKFDTWEESSPFPRGLIEQRIGTSGDFESEKKALEWQACPWKYPKYAYVPEWKEEKGEERIALQGYTFHIDPKGCRDVDDAITMRRLPTHEWEITISISDVAGYVEDGSAIDILASLIGETLYDSNGKVIRPMLPAEYSEGACSLLPGKVSHGVSLQCIWNGLEMVSKKWLLTSFQTDDSYEYDECLPNGSEYFQILHEFTSYLAKSKSSLSSRPADSVEQILKTMDSHQWIEQLMLLYNTEVGTLLKEIQMGILRRHNMPDQERWKAYEHHLPQWKHLAMSAAEYCLAEEKESWHYGLQTNAYAHASSPIRRYADLINQRILKKWILATDRSSMESYIVPVATVDLNQRTKAVRHYARDMDYLCALETGLTQFQAIVLEKKELPEDQIKLRLYVEAWKRIVSTVYKKGSTSDSIRSRDETYEVNAPLYSSVMITCTYNLQMRNWKDRVILRIDRLPSPSIEE
jgi:exoribonuclease R